MARLRDEAKRAWEHTLEIYRHLSAGGAPEILDLDEVELGPDEVAIGEHGFMLDLPSRVRSTGSEVVWIEHGPVRAVLTTDRIVCQGDSDTLVYRHDELVTVEFDAEEWLIELRYHGCDPIRLTGWESLAYAIVLMWLQGGPEALAGPAFRVFRPD